MEVLEILTAAYLFCCIVFFLAILSGEFDRFSVLLMCILLALGFLLLCSPSVGGAYQEFQRERLQQEICAEVEERSHHRIECSFEENLGTVRFKDRAVLRITDWTGNRKNLRDTMCQEADFVREIFQSGSESLYECESQKERTRK